MHKKGLFITFEGADGSGKTTQLELTEKYLKEKNIDYIVTRNPGGTNLGKNFREILLNYEGKISSTCEMLLYLADISQNVDLNIVPAVNKGKIVLCDRYTDSTIAYQGYARGLNLEELTCLEKIATHSLKPDLTLLYDVDTETAMKRVGDTKDRLESEAADFHQKVRQGYLELAKQAPDRIKVINANRCIDEVYQETLKIINQYLNL